MADEGGVWRTISGRRVFIRHGQTLTDAMRESGKFNKENFNDTKELRRVYGKDEGQSYRVLTGSNEYELTGTENGKSIEIPKNESGELTVFKAPKTSGFVDGKYVSDENRNAFFSDGRVVLTDYAFNNHAASQVHAMIEHETLRLAGVIKDGQFYRGTDNKAEINYLRNGTMRASTNHMTGEKEDGVSVWESPKYLFKYTYRVTGDVVSVGSDGEPVLDPKSIKLVSEKNYRTSDYNEGMEKGKSLFCETYGWTAEQYDDALNRKIKNKSRL